MSLEKEMQRIEGKRARNVARTARYLDARLRTIGLDTDALDEQMREQRDRKERERVSGRTLYESLRHGGCCLFWTVLWWCLIVLAHFGATDSTTAVD